MPNREHARTIALTPPFVRGFVLLATRILRVRETEAKAIAERLTPGRSLTFGELWELTAEDVGRVAASAGANPSPLDVRAFADLCHALDPWTAICGNCGEFALMGSDSQAHLPGSVCVSCPSGTVERLLVVLRTINWMTGALVDPGLREDVVSIPGVAIPLTDEQIRAWAGRVDALLERELKAVGLSLHAFLAYCNLRLYRPETFGPGKAARLLENPREFGLDTQYEIERAIDAACRFTDAREITNLPRVYLTDGRARRNFEEVTINGRPYLLEGRIGQGDSYDVFRGRTDGDMPLFVTVKVLMADGDRDFLLREERNLVMLARANVSGSELFKPLVPELVTSGIMRRADRSRWPVIVCRYQHGMDWSLEDVFNAYSNGLDGRDIAWMANRLFLILDWCHEVGLVHGAILPPHLMVHARDRAMNVVGWSMAVATGWGLPGISAAYENCYPEDALAGKPVSAKTDIVMAARTLILMAGGDPALGTLPADFPKPLEKLLVGYAQVAGNPASAVEWNAMAAYNAFRMAAREAFGPPSYRPFHMPPELGDEGR